MMWFRSSICVSLAALLLASCSGPTNKNPNSTGRGSEIIVVGNKQKWDGPAGDTIRSVLMRNMEGLPEAEPEFTLIFIPEKSFDKFLQSHRNILFMDIQAGNKTGKVETLKNPWSHPQRVIKIKANSDTAFISQFLKHSEAIRELFNQNERARFSSQNSLARNGEVEKLLSEQLGINMIVSKDFYKAKKVSDFVWLRSETNANTHFEKNNF